EIARQFLVLQQAGAAVVPRGSCCRLRRSCLTGLRLCRRFGSRTGAFLTAGREDTRGGADRQNRERACLPEYDLIPPIEGRDYRRSNAMWIDAARSAVALPVLPLTCVP